MMSKRSFSAFWSGSPLGPYEQLAVASFVSAEHEVRVYSYDEGLALPEGVTLCDAREVVDEERLRSFPGGVTHFSNHFRYRLLDSSSTIWFDTDLVLLEPRLLPDAGPIFASQSDGLINTSLLGLPPGSAVLQKLISESDAAPTSDLRWGSLGPRLLTEVLEAGGLSSHALPTDVVYPLGPTNIWWAFDASEIDRCRRAVRGAMTLHLWNQYLKKLGFKEVAPQRGSLLAELASRHGVEFALPEIEPGRARAVSLGKFGQDRGMAALVRRVERNLTRVVARLRSTV